MTPMHMFLLLLAIVFIFIMILLVVLISKSNEDVRKFKEFNDAYRESINKEIDYYTKKSKQDAGND